MTRNEKKLLNGVLWVGGLGVLGWIAAAAMGGVEQKKPNGPPSKREMYANEIAKLVAALNTSAYRKHWWRQSIAVLEQIAVKVTPYGWLLKPVFQAENDYFAGKIPKNHKLEYALNLVLGS